MPRGVEGVGELIDAARGGASTAAETHATKCALMTFSNAFGLPLYGGSADTKAKATPHPVAAVIDVLPEREEAGVPSHIPALPGA